MPVNLVSDDELRAALRPYRVDPAPFEAGVRTRLEAAQRQRADDPLAGRSPFLRSAAAFLPLAILAGCKASPAESKLAPAAGGYKLLSYLAFPAISLFVLLGATIFSVVKIRGIRERNDSELADQQAINEVARQWWSRHKWGAAGVFAATLTLAANGATWLLFLSYVVSFGILLYVLAAFAKLGMGNREVVGSSCAMGLMFLGQIAGFSGIGEQEIHFLDQSLVVAVFYGGTLVLLPFILVGSPVANISGQQMGTVRRWMLAVIYPIIVVSLMARMMNPILWPATPSRIKHHVESFDQAPHQLVSWQHWEIAAQWAIDSKLDPDLSNPRRLLAKEISGGQNRFILSSALRVGLLPADQLSQLKEYQQRRHSLVDAPPSGLKPQVITSLNQMDWVIRAAVLRQDFSPQERDLLEQRLHATLEYLLETSYVTLDELLRATQLLEVLDRPVNRDQYRERVQNLLRKFHTKNGGGFQLAGGFKTYLIWPAGSGIAQTGSLESTAYAVELMEIYGVPDDLDLNWVRSFLKPTALRFNDKWVAAATLDRLNHLPGVTPPTWLEFLYYERSLLAAAVLVGLCFYATVCSPKLKPIAPEEDHDPLKTTSG